MGRTDALLLCGDDEAVEGVDAGVEATRSEVLGNVIDPRDLPPSDRAAARDALGVAHRDPVVVCAARLSHQKGQDVLFEAWARAGRPGVLVLVGALKGAPALVDQLPPGTTVVIPASRRDVLLWCAAADVVVAPSRYEGMSLGVLEAAAMGAPVVATDVGGMRQALAGTPATFVRPEDPAALAAALTGAVEARAELAETAARAAVVLRARLAHDWSAGAQRLDALYRDLTGLPAAVEAHLPVAPATTDQLPAHVPGSHRGAPLAAPREHDRARPPAVRHHSPAVVGNIPVGGSR